MAEVVKNLSYFHVIYYWSKWRVVDVVRELMSFARCPQLMRENFEVLFDSVGKSTLVDLLEN